MASKNSEYRQLIEDNKKIDAFEAMKEEYRKQLIFENDLDIEQKNQSKIKIEEKINRAGSVALKPKKRGNPTERKAFNGVYCLGKGMSSN